MINREPVPAIYRPTLDPFFNYIPLCFYLGEVSQISRSPRLLLDMYLLKTENDDLRCIYRLSPGIISSSRSIDQEYDVQPLPAFGQRHPLNNTPEADNRTEH